MKQVVLESEAGDQIFLVTDNSTDYCDDAGNLVPDLLAEVEGAGGHLSRVANLDDLLGLVEFAPLVASLAKTNDQLSAFLALAAGSHDPDAEPPSVDQVVRSAVFDACERLAGEDVEAVNESTYGLDFTELGIPGSLEGLSIDTVEPDGLTLDWQTYETYQDTTLLIQAEIHAEISLDGFAYKGDLGHLDDIENVHVLEWDWNDHMAHVATTVGARLTFQIRLEQGMHFVDECEFEGALPLVDDDPHSMS